MAEVVAAGLQERGRAVIVGQRTQGKGTGQSLVWRSSPGGDRSEAVRVSDRAYYRLDSRPLQKYGVTPDTELPAAGATTERERDGALSLEAIAPTPACGHCPVAAPIDDGLLEATVAWLLAGSEATGGQKASSME
ncbi:MAG: S41 family peptidase [Myxococcales bacterium]|nr:S41 family peptidase [Myxococcales bacterium]